MAILIARNRRRAAFPAPGCVCHRVMEARSSIASYARISVRSLREVWSAGSWRGKLRRRPEAIDPLIECPRRQRLPGRHLGTSVSDHRRFARESGCALLFGLGRLRGV